MIPYASAADYWQLTLKINFSGVIPEAAQGQDRGWAEKYYFPPNLGLGAGSPAPPYGPARAVVTARAALLSQNMNIARVTLSQASGYRDRWPIGPVATYPLLTDGDISDYAGSFCNEVEDGLLYRFEKGTQRFHYIIRGVRDRWMNDQAFWKVIGTTSFGPFSAVTVGGIGFDSGPIAAPMTPTAGAGTPGTVTFTNTVGVLSVPAFVSPGTGLTYNGSGSTSFYVNLYPKAYTGNVPQQLHVTITGGIITAATVLPAAGAPAIVYPAGYQYVLDPDTDALTLQQYLDDSVYAINFGNTVATYCESFHADAVSITDVSLPADVTLAWLGKGTKIPCASLLAPYSINDPGPSRRWMIERTANRQTGKIYTTKKARRKIAK
jgi:hypothetical protein